MLNENKNTTEKLKGMSDYNSVKNEIKFQQEKLMLLDTDNSNFKIQNQSLQKNTEKLRENLVEETRKYEILKIEVLLI